MKGAITVNISCSRYSRGATSVAACIHGAYIRATSAVKLAHACFGAACAGQRAHHCRNNCRICFHKVDAHFHRFIGSIAISFHRLTMVTHTQPSGDCSELYHKDVKTWKWLVFTECLCKIPWMAQDCFISRRAETTSPDAVTLVLQVNMRASKWTDDPGLPTEHRSCLNNKNIKACFAGSQ
ncbi:uncharacterized protein LOC142566264 isoform X2 [Dermacentor variabilis]|uniref:uncharacterized protein LOC142566264 isoform X2 n=1 Tax=Dermacentor variabilis TaxID=34621 RepID=UPI003F5C572C